MKQLYGADGKAAFQILICLIQIWNKNDEKTFMVPPTSGLMEFTEVENVEIQDTYKEFINTAKIRFPRGTVVRKTSETIDELTEIDAAKVSASVDSRGLIVETRNSYSELASVSDFNIDQRIRIYLAYTTDPEIASLPKYIPGRGSIHTDRKLYDRYFAAVSVNGPAFDGYVFKCSIDTPIELECESIAARLKYYSAPNIPNPKNLCVNDILEKGGKYYALGDSGFEFFKEDNTKKSVKIYIGNVPMNKDYTLADIFSEWSRHNLYTYVWVDYKANPPKPYLVVGRSYFTNEGADSIVRQRKKQGFMNTVDVNFNYDVASNGLTLMNTNKDFLCIKGESMTKDGKSYRMTLRRKLSWKPGDPKKDKWEILNETKLSKKMIKAGATKMSKGTKTHEMDRYTVIPYYSPNIGVSHEQLFDEMVKYYENFNVNGIDGKLTVFGDKNLRSGMRVHLIDPYYTAKNGIYLIDEVETSFGTKGFRQTIKIPYCISRDNEKKAKGTNSNEYDDQWQNTDAQIPGQLA